MLQLAVQGRSTERTRRPQVCGDTRALRWPGLAYAVYIVMAVCLGGCATTLAERQFVPEVLIDEAQPAGIAGARMWGDEVHANYVSFFKAEGPALRKKYLDRQRQGLPLQSNMLALSGGADDGAFGAGLLVGWGERGDRPVFDLVTGVSAGALIAPFAFLGRDYDHALAELFTRYSSDQIYESNVLAGLFGGSAVATSGPLKRLIDKYVDRQMVRRIAEERGKGRLLLVGTTNIDAQRPVYWDLGKIAQAGDAHAIETMRNVLLASASIPGVFPPVRITVRAKNKTFEELHVDGGTSREVFFSPADFSFRDLDKTMGLKPQRRLYIVRNGKIGPEWQATQENTLAIGQRALETLIKSQVLGDLARMHSKALADGLDYNLAAIPEGFKAPRPQPFDQGYMTALYKAGLALGQAGYDWAKAPPGPSVEKPR